MKNLFFWSAASAVMLLLLFYFDDFIPNRLLLALVLICAGAVFFHVRQNRRDPEHLSKALGLDEGAVRRDSACDLIRVLAAVFVILNHTYTCYLAAGLAVNPLKHAVLTYLNVVTIFCNPLFVMLSGALLLRFKEEKLTAFYGKRLVKILLPMALCYVYYLWMDGRLRGVSFGVGFYYTLLCLISGHTPESPHYWLLYAIISLYLVFPFFRYMMKGMPAAMLQKFCILILILMGIAKWPFLLPIEPGISTFMGTWIGVAILGYFVFQKETRRWDRQILAAGFLSLLVIGILVLCGADVMDLCTNLSPLAVIPSMALFVLSIRVAPAIQGLPKRLLSMTAKHSFAIMLIHLFLLYRAIDLGQKLKAVLGFGEIGYTLYYLTGVPPVTFGASFILAIGIEGLAAYFFETLFKNLLGFIRKMAGTRSLPSEPPRGGEGEN